MSKADGYNQVSGAWDSSTVYSGVEASLSAEAVAPIAAGAAAPETSTPAASGDASVMPDAQTSEKGEK